MIVAPGLRIQAGSFILVTKKNNFQKIYSPGKTTTHNVITTTLAWTEKHLKVSQQTPSNLNKSPFFPETGNIPK